MKLKSWLLMPFLLAVFTFAIPQTTYAASCKPSHGSFLGFPTWYEYLNGEEKTVTDNQGNSVTKCEVRLSEDTNQSIKSNLSLNSIWLIGLALLEILLRLAGLVTFGIIVFGGFKYITSQGQPDATKSARQTIINAFIGLVITIIAATAINFGAGLLQ